jgi:hypothetical protein
MDKQGASIPVFSNRFHPSDPVSVATHESIRLVHHGAYSKLLHLKEIHTHILLCGIIKACGVAIEGVDSEEFNWLTWVLDLSNICLLQLDSLVSGLQLNPNKGVISEKNFGLKSFILALVDDYIWSDLLVPESAIRVAYKHLGRLTSSSTNSCSRRIISLEEGVAGDYYRQVVDSEETIRMLESLLVPQVILHKNEQRGLVEGSNLS